MAAGAEHRAFVVGAVIQCAAALEAEVSELLHHGPGHQLGSSGIDHMARGLLEPIHDVIENEPVLRQYEVVLHLLGRPAFDRGASPYQEAALLVKLRNELVHFKSKWGPEMEGTKLLAALEQLRFAKPPFESPSTNFFPNRCLSSSLASWCVSSVVDFINDFYGRIEIQSSLQPYEDRLSVPALRLLSTA